MSIPPEDRSPTTTARLDQILAALYQHAMPVPPTTLAAFLGWHLQYLHVLLYVLVQDGDVVNYRGIVHSTYALADATRERMQDAVLDLPPLIAAEPDRPLRGPQSDPPAFPG